MVAAHIDLFVLGVPDVKFKRLEGDAPARNVVQNVSTVVML